VTAAARLEKTFSRLHVLLFKTPPFVHIIGFGFARYAGQ